MKLPDFHEVLDGSTEPGSRVVCFVAWIFTPEIEHTLRLHGMSWGVKTICFKAQGVSLGGSGVSIGGVRIVRVVPKNRQSQKETHLPFPSFFRGELLNFGGV